MRVAVILLVGLLVEGPSTGCKIGFDEDGQAVAASGVPLSTALGARFSCALDSASVIWCWGGNFFASTPTVFDNSRRWQQIAAGEHHLCAIDDTDKLYCMGVNVSGALGLGDLDARTLLTAVLPDQSIQSVSAGRFHTCAVGTNNRLWCFGDNEFGPIGNNSFGDSVPEPFEIVVSGVDWQQPVAGGNHSCAFSTTNELYCWGANEAGQLGTGSVEEIIEQPTLVGAPDGVAWQGVGLGKHHTCALADSGELYCWGQNDVGQLGVGDTDNRASPTVVEPEARFSSLGVGRFNVCAVREDGVGMCAGNNEEGAVGVPGQDFYLEPVVVQVDNDWKSISGSIGAQTCGLDSADALYCWGANNDGVLGLPGGSRPSPTPVSLELVP